MIDVGRLRALDAVAIYGTVLAASEALRCTPSAVSQQLSKLERETKTTLVEKDGRRLRLTQAGRILAGHATRVIAALDEAEGALAAHRDTVSGQLTVAAFATACRALLPYALRQLATDHPQLTTGLIECNPHEALDALARGRVDLAVIDDWPEATMTLPAGVTQIELGVDVADLLVPADHHLAATPTAAPGRPASSVLRSQVLGERWITSTPGTICHEWVLRILPGVEPVFLVGEFETQITLVAAGLGVAMVPRLARPQLPPGVAVVAVRPRPTRRVRAAWRMSAAGRPAIHVAAEALRAAWDHHDAALHRDLPG